MEETLELNDLTKKEIEERKKEKSVSHKEVGKILNLKSSK